MKITIAEGSWGADFILRRSYWSSTSSGSQFYVWDSSHRIKPQWDRRVRSGPSWERLSQYPQGAPIPASLLQKKSWESSTDTRTLTWQFGSTSIFKCSKSSTNRTNYDILLGSPGAFLRHLPPKQHKRYWNEPEWLEEAATGTPQKRRK